MNLTRMKADIAAWCRDCVACQRAKSVKQTRASVQPIPIPARRFSHVHVDLVGPFPASEDGFLYIFTIIDRTTMWLEAVPLKDLSSASCMEAFLASWVAQFDVPETITSDRGSQFTAASWASFCTQLGMRHAMTTAYHPQANGLVERAHRQLKDALKAWGVASQPLLVVCKRPLTFTSSGAAPGLPCPWRTRAHTSWSGLGQNTLFLRSEAARRWCRWIG